MEHPCLSLFLCARHSKVLTEKYRTLFFPTFKRGRSVELRQKMGYNEVQAHQFGNNTEEVIILSDLLQMHSLMLKSQEKDGKKIPMLFIVNKHEKKALPVNLSDKNAYLISKIMNRTLDQDDMKILDNAVYEMLVFGGVKVAKAIITRIDHRNLLESELYIQRSDEQEKVVQVNAFNAIFLSMKFSAPVYFKRELLKHAVDVEIKEKEQEHDPGQDQEQDPGPKH